MKIRELLDTKKRNRLVFEEKVGDVETVVGGELLNKYFDVRENDTGKESVVICFSNQSASQYNKSIREKLYGEVNPELKVGDVLMVVQNNYQLDKMNGEFVSVSFVGEKVKQSAPVYVQKGGTRQLCNITLSFQHVQVSDAKNNPMDCMLLLDLLNDGSPSLGIDRQKALYINFCMRHPHLKLGSKEFTDALLADAYCSCLKAKYGYAVTGHKCQGGEWKKVFVDYSGRTGLSNDCLRWAYTATTRARETLFIFNLPHITPFSRFRIEPVQKCVKMNPECRIIGHVEPSPFHNSSAPDYLHAKCRCIMTNMEHTLYEVVRVDSKPYQEIYHVQTPDGIEYYDVRYKKGGIFLKVVPREDTQHSLLICMMLNSERALPLVFNYSPKDEIHNQLYNLIRSVCDELNIQITNVVEESAYCVNYYFRTSDNMSYLKIYIDDSDNVTYAKPMSMIGEEDKELLLLIEYIQNHFE